MFPAGSSPATLPAALVLASAALLGGFLRPSGATLALAALSPLLAGLPRVWGETSEPPLLPLVAVSLLAGALARRRRDGEGSSLSPALARWGGAFLLVAACSAAASALRGEGLYLLLRGGASPVFVNAFGMTAAERAREAAVLLSVYAVLLAALDAFGAVAREARGRVRLAAALSAGLAAAGVAVLLERLAGLPLTAERWARIDRFSGLSSDPNALGLLGATLAPLLAGLLALRPKRAVAASAAGGLALLLPLLERSGSRTGLLLLAVAAAAAALGLVRAGGRARRLAFGACAAGVALLAVALAAAPRGGETNRGGLVARLGSSLSARSALLLSSHRPMFWGAAFDMLAAEPLSGIGLAGFPFEFPAVHEKRAGALPPATDNATNLLLDVAAECGLPALLLALGAAVPLLRRAGEAAFAPGLGDPLGRAAGASLVGFAVASLTGSHLRFADVAVAVAAAAALLPAPREETLAGGVSRPRRLLPVLAGSGALAALLVAAGTARPESAFRWGRWAGVHDHGRPRRWSSAEAFRRVAPGERRLDLALADERPDGLPVSVRVRVDDADAGTIRLEPGDPRRFRIALAPGSRVVRLSVSPTFVPRLLGTGPDGRELGVRIHSDGGTAP